MGIFIKILLFVLVGLIANVNATIATITFPNIQEATVYSSFHTEIPKTVLKVIENDRGNCCQNEKDLLDYRNWVLASKANAAKDGSTSAVWLESSDHNLAGYTWLGNEDYAFFGKHLGEASVKAFKTNLIARSGGEAFGDIISATGVLADYTIMLPIDFVGAAYDFSKNYSDMREAN